jgi:hypothetical protein
LFKQLGAVITQGNRLIVFFSRNMTATRQHYSMAIIEPLAIVETLKACCGDKGPRSAQTTKT